MSTIQNTNPPTTKLLLSINEAKEMLGCGRDKIYELMKNGILDDRKMGYRRKIVAQSVYNYVDSLPAYQENRKNKY
jgi:excisionase family DNA binding protein